MQKRNLFRHSIGGVLAVAFLCAMSNGTTSAGSFTRGCAARDMQVLILIEERERASAISAQESTDAILTMMHARMVCYEGRVLDALALYENITQNLNEPRTIARWEK